MRPQRGETSAIWTIVRQMRPRGKEAMVRNATTDTSLSAAADATFRRFSPAPCTIGAGCFRARPAREGERSIPRPASGYCRQQLGGRAEAGAGPCDQFARAERSRYQRRSRDWGKTRFRSGSSASRPRRHYTCHQLAPQNCPSAATKELSDQGTRPGSALWGL